MTTERTTDPTPRTSDPSVVRERQAALDSYRARVRLARWDYVASDPATKAELVAALDVYNAACAAYQDQIRSGEIEGHGQ